MLALFFQRLVFMLVLNMHTFEYIALSIATAYLGYKLPNRAIVSCTWKRSFVVPNMLIHEMRGFFDAQQLFTYVSG